MFYKEAKYIYDSQQKCNLPSPTSTIPQLFFTQKWWTLMAVSNFYNPDGKNFDIKQSFHVSNLKSIIFWFY